MAVVVHLRASGDQDLDFLFPLVVQAFDNLAPAGVFVDLIQNDQSGPSRESLLEDQIPIIEGVPVQITGLAFRGSGAK